MEQNFICVKWGTKYHSDEVNRLFAAIKRNTSRDLRFFCLTDDRDGLAHEIEQLPLVETILQRQIADAQGGLRRKNGALRKMSAFDPELIPDLNGPLLCADIDILITGDVDDVYQYEPSRVCMPPPFKAKSHIETKGEGSIIRFDPKLHEFLFEDMATRTEEMLSFSMGSEQRYTSFSAYRHNALTNFPPEWIVGFFRHCCPLRPLNLFVPPSLPTKAKIICFPSMPKADQAISGYRSGLRSTRPAPWITEFV